MKTENAVTRATTRGLKPKQLTIGRSRKAMNVMGSQTLSSFTALGLTGRVGRK